MARLWPSALLIGLGLAALALAPTARSCITTVGPMDTMSACDGSGTMILSIAGFALLAIGVLWWLATFVRTANQ